jgi:hypothetical protein
MSTETPPVVDKSRFEILAAGPGTKWFAYQTRHKLADVLRANYFLNVARTLEPYDRIEVVAEIDTDEPKFASLYVVALVTRVGELRRPLRFCDTGAIRAAGLRMDAAIDGVVLQTIRYTDAEPQQPPRKHDLAELSRPATAA